MITLDLIRGALRRINSYQPGETIAPADANDALETLNDLLDSWSTDHLYVYGSNENIVTYMSGVSQYRIGNPTNASLGEPNIVGTIVGGAITVAGSLPTDLIVGATLTCAGIIPIGAVVTAVGSGTIAFSPPATVIPSSNPSSIGYSVPGDFAFERPLRITNGFTRINDLDFTIEVTMSQDRFLEILYKAQPGPWPTVAWYNNLMPYGVINFYQTPSSNAECHLFTDTLLGDLTINQNVNLPPGYSRAIKWCLAKELCAEYGFPMTESIKTNAAESLNMIKALNAVPAVQSKYDRMLTGGNRPDGGWILNGGYR
jgi:hypothetical protein